MSKVEFYQQISQQVSAIISDEADIIANMANISAILFDALEDVNWVGFYRVVDKAESKQPELVLGPFQGKVVSSFKQEISTDHWDPILGEDWIGIGQ